MSAGGCVYRTLSWNCQTTSEGHLQANEIVGRVFLEISFVFGFSLHCLQDIARWRWKDRRLARLSMIQNLEIGSIRGDFSVTKVQLVNFETGTRIIGEPDPHNGCTLIVWGWNRRGMYFASSIIIRSLSKERFGFGALSFAVDEIGN